jgi:3'-phosphoadenosine 5'-phosphosulfate sulfotransferase
MNGVKELSGRRWMSKIKEYLRNLFRKEYHVSVFLNGDRTFPNGSQHMTVALKKISKINNKQVVGVDANNNKYEFNSVDDFNYQVKKVS